MGVMDQSLESLRADNKKRGSVNNTDRLAVFAQTSNTTGADWGAASSTWVYEVIVKITALGGAVLFGVGRDGGSHSLVLMLDNKKVQLWFNADADLDEKLEEVAATLDSLS